MHYNYFIYLLIFLYISYILSFYKLLYERDIYDYVISFIYTHIPREKPQPH